KPIFDLTSSPHKPPVPPKTPSRPSTEGNAVGQSPSENTVPISLEDIQMVLDTMPNSQNVSAKASLQYFQVNKTARDFVMSKIKEVKAKAESKEPVRVVPVRIEVSSLTPAPASISATTDKKKYVLSDEQKAKYKETKQRKLLKISQNRPVKSSFIPRNVPSTKTEKNKQIAAEKKAKKDAETERLLQIARANIEKYSPSVKVHRDSSFLSCPNSNVIPYKRPDEATSRLINTKLSKHQASTYSDFQQRKVEQSTLSSRLEREVPISMANDTSSPEISKTTESDQHLGRVINSGPISDWINNEIKGNNTMPEAPSLKRKNEDEKVKRPKKPYVSIAKGALTPEQILQVEKDYQAGQEKRRKTQFDTASPVTTVLTLSDSDSSNSLAPAP
ncbi:hypothetical protein HOH87_01260, partial [bacterium]|nr:hypothetical protein [bacterium]